MILLVVYFWRKLFSADHALVYSRQCHLMAIYSARDFVRFAHIDLSLSHPNVAITLITFATTYRNGSHETDRP